MGRVHGEGVNNPPKMDPAVCFLFFPDFLSETLTFPNIGFYRVLESFKNLEPSFN
jgi:hypothetical protein